MGHKYFLKDQSSLQRKDVAIYLAVTFVLGTVGSGFAGVVEIGSDNEDAERKLKM